MKIYTKTGDTGKTSIIGGTRLLKSNVRIEAYGTMDEANSWLGSIVAELPQKDFPQLKEELLNLQVLLFDLGTDIATPMGVKSYLVTNETLRELEEMIDTYVAKVPPITEFILPGGHLIASHFQILRTIIRRQERLMVRLMEQEEVNPYAYQVINRLSDLFFVLGRYVNHYYQEKEHFYHKAGKVFH